MTDTGEIYARAAAFQDLRRYDEALHLLRQAVAIEPDNGAALAAMARCLHRLGRPEEALSAADQALAVEPGLVDAHVARAWVLMDMAGGAEQAWESAAAAAQLAPWCEPALQALATAHLACGDPAGAESVAQVMLAQDPMSVEGRFLLGSCALMREDWVAAEQHLESVLGMEPGSAPALVNLALVAIHTGRHDVAAARLSEAARLEPQPHSALHVARSMYGGIEARLLASHTPGEIAASLLEAARSTSAERPPFVVAMMRAMAGHMLLRSAEGSPVDNVVAGVELIESVADVDPQEECPPAPLAGVDGESDGSSVDADVVARGFQAAAWLGGPEFREDLRLQWLQDAAEANLVAIPHAGDRRRRVRRCLELMDAFLAMGYADREPFAQARSHMIAGRAASMQADGDRLDNAKRAVEHFAAAQEIYLRVRTVGDRANAELYLGGALLDLPPDADGELQEMALAHLQSALSSPAMQAHTHQLAVTHATYGEGLYQRLKIYGREEDFEEALEHFGAAAELFAAVGQSPPQAHFLEFMASCWLIRPRGNETANADRALEILEEAGQLISRSGTPTRWSGLQACIAKALLVADDGVATRDRAVEHALAGVSDRDSESDPADWARKTRTLALALATRADSAGARDAAADAERALDLMRQAVPILEERSNLPDVADLCRESAGVLRVAACRLIGDAPVEQLLDEASVSLSRGLDIAEPRRYLRTAALLRLERARLAVAANLLTGSCSDPRPDLEHAYAFYVSTGDEHRAAAVFWELERLTSGAPESSRMTRVPGA